MLEFEWINVTDLAITRADKTGPGGDAGTETTVADGLDAVYEAVTRIVKNAQGQEVVSSGFFMVDPVDNSGEAIDVRAGDWVQWTDYRNKLSKKQEVVRVDPRWLGGELHHVEMDLA